MVRDLTLILAVSEYECISYECAQSDLKIASSKTSIPFLPVAAKTFNKTFNKTSNKTSIPLGAI
jgi:hypothetical protein